MEQGFAERHVVDDINRSVLLAVITHVYGWKHATWVWVPNAESNEYVVTGLDASLAVTAADERIGQWEAIAFSYPAVTKGNAIPEPGPDWATHAGEGTTPEIATILRYVDGRNTVSQIAAVCGFARFEIAGRLAKAVADGILAVRDPNAKPSSPDDEFEVTSVTMRDVYQAEFEAAKQAVALAQQTLANAEARLVKARAALSVN
ncbi:MAG: hypothetical protein ACYC3W_10310 [Candidatus Nanopelagicales bacterium]